MADSIGAIITILQTRGYNMVVKVQALDSEDLGPDFSSGAAHLTSLDSVFLLLLTCQVLGTKPDIQ